MIAEEKKSGSTTRDVGIQSRAGEFSSESSYSPSAEEHSEQQTADSSVSSTTGKQISEPQVIIRQTYLGPT